MSLQLSCYAMYGKEKWGVKPEKIKLFSKAKRAFFPRHSKSETKPYPSLGEHPNSVRRYRERDFDVGISKLNNACPAAATSRLGVVIAVLPFLH